MDIDLGLSEGDHILYIPTNQIGVIKRVWRQKDNDKYELKLLEPDQTLWSLANQIKLITPVA